MPRGVFPRTAAHKRHISLALRGKKKQYSVWNKGLTKETSAKVFGLSRRVSKTLTGKRRSSASIQKQKESMHKLYERQEIRAKYSASRVGDKNPNWRGGTDRDPYPFQFNYELKAKIRERDGHVCQLCGIREDEHINAFRRNLAINHINYDKTNNDASNLISLCMSCNSKVNWNRKYWTRYFRNLLKQTHLRNCYKA